MDAAEFRATRKALGLTQMGFCKAFGVARRTAQNWEKKGPPEYIGRLLATALAANVQPPGNAPGNCQQADEALLKLSPGLEALLASATASGWSRAVVLSAIEMWARQSA
ncbi:helix-turn-helix domain-containing protein [Bosea sp. 2KB_26]|uniref:helix-turn-helix domain-containing protein n=1 Tax=Bosea sp. 2KB_26 TaxID=3237475 RepID=UPI003F936FD0